MRVDVLLADSAESVNGKAYILGAGWSVQNGPAPTSVVVFVTVPWDRSNEPFEWVLELRSDDGELVHIPGPVSEQVIQVGGHMEVGRPPGTPHGTPLDTAPIVLNVGPLELPPGRYEWRFSINGETHELWTRAFTRL